MTTIICKAQNVCPMIFVWKLVEWVSWEKDMQQVEMLCMSWQSFTTYFPLILSLTFNIFSTHLNDIVFKTPLDWIYLNQDAHLCGHTRSFFFATSHRPTTTLNTLYGGLDQFFDVCELSNPAHANHSYTHFNSSFARCAWAVAKKKFTVLRKIDRKSRPQWVITVIFARYLPRTEAVRS